MSVIDLSKRNSQDWEEMNQHLQSSDSSVYIDPKPLNGVVAPSMDLEVGNAYIIPGSNESFKIPDNGIKIKPRQSVVLFTRQRFKLPYNVFGVVTGKGTFIFKGCFLSTGKIDPGFDGLLKIGFFNGGTSSIVLKPKEAFATVYFLNTDSTLAAPLPNYQTSLEHDMPQLKWFQRLWMYVKEHWVAFIAWAIVAIPTFLLYSAQFIDLIKEWLSRK